MRKFLELAVVALFQYVFIQLVTFLVSLPLSALTDHPETKPDLFVLFLGFTISVGVFLAGWLSLKFKWLNVQPKHLLRLIGTVLGSYLPLLIGLLIYKTLEAGNPTFFIAMAASIFGYHLPTCLSPKSTSL